MSRTKLGGLGNRTDRLPLRPRNSPYWLVMEKGRALGYRKGANGGTWVARFHDPCAPRLFKPLGAADDITDADGVMVLSCAQAQEKAREWFRTAYFQVTGERVQVGVYTVRDAVEDYLADRERHGMAKRSVSVGRFGFIRPSDAAPRKPQGPLWRCLSRARIPRRPDAWRWRP